MSVILFLDSKLEIMPKIDRSSHPLRYLVALLLVLGSAACESRLDTRGNLLDPNRLAEIKTGQHTRDEVAEILGSPSSIAAFDKETWYYISKRTETFAFFEPDVSDRQVVILRFDSQGVVTEVTSLGLKDGHVVQPVDRVTPTAGNEITIIKQLIGNLGRFNK